MTKQLMAGILAAAAVVTLVFAASPSATIATNEASPSVYSITLFHEAMTR